MKQQKLNIGILLLSLSFSFILKAQTVSGTAFYKSQQNVEVSLDSGMAPEQAAMIKQMMQEQMSNDYELTFNNHQSFFKQKEKLDQPSQNESIQIMVITPGGNELYKNLKENRYTSERELFGKLFLVQDTMPKIDWVLTGETKQIGQYTCYKATYTRMSRGGFKMDSENGESLIQPKEIVTTAWYTPQIPISDGPEMYYGLPGLILEVIDGDRVLICLKIVLNPEEEVLISKPKKGKKVSSAEYEALMEEKLQEMQEMNRGGQKKGKGEYREITIER